MKKKRTISTAQISKIWASARDKSIDKDDVYALVYQVSNQESMKSLTWIQANEVINRIVGTNTIDGVQRTGRESTQEMRKKIYMLTKELGWEKNPKRLAGFCKKLFKVEKVEWLDRKQCYKLIEALKKMVERSKHEDHRTGSR